MSTLNETPRSNRITISVFGKRNAGKSSLVNAITNQPVSLVSDVAGTTTDPVYKSMELLPLGPVVFVDTAGLDDEGFLGEMRVQKAKDVLQKTHLGILVIDAVQGVTRFELDFAKEMKSRKIPCIAVLNQIDQKSYTKEELMHMEKELSMPVTPASAGGEKTCGIEEIKANIIRYAKYDQEEVGLTDNLIQAGQTAVLVTPIDTAAPKGRLILPQQQTIRDILDRDAMAVVTKETELRKTLENLKKPPAIVITDSQAFNKVSADTPESIPLTSFSILFARQKGDLVEMTRGVRAIRELQTGDKVLIMEACTHHRQTDDIGTVKIPRWLRQLTGADLQLEWASGASFPKNIQQYKVIIHCGACMVNRREMQYRLSHAREQGVPITNYGMVIAYTQGILQRALTPFPDALQEIN